jgi:hypothetical protein
VCPDFLANHLRRLATQALHLHHRFDRSQIQLDLPIMLRPLFTVYLGVRIAELGDDPCVSYRRFVVGIVSSTGLLLSRQLCL